jgi:hypothetical protein
VSRISVDKEGEKQPSLAHIEAIFVKKIIIDILNEYVKNDTVWIVVHKIVLNENKELKEAISQKDGRITELETKVEEQSKEIEYVESAVEMEAIRQIIADAYGISLESLKTVNLYLEQIIKEMGTGAKIQLKIKPPPEVLEFVKKRIHPKPTDKPP